MSSTIIIGNGIAGNSAAQAIADINPDHRVTLISHEPHRFYSPCVMSKYLSDEMPRAKVFPRIPPSSSRDKLALRLGERVTALDTGRMTVALGQETLSYDKLVLATGAMSAVPDVRGVDKERVFAFKTLDDIETLRQFKAGRAVVIGTGPMGIEAAVALRKRGLEVAVVGRRARIMPRLFDDRPAGLLKDAMVGHGVQMATGESFLEILGDGRAEAVLTDKRRIECDLVVLCVGVNPLVDLAKGAGIELGASGGIKVDHHMRTSAEAVYACGDCVETTDIIDGRPTLALNWTTGRRTGEVAGYNAAGRLRTYAGSLSSRSIDVFELFAFAIGLGSDRLSGRQYQVIEKQCGASYYCLLVAGGALVGAQAVGDDQGIGMLYGFLTRKDNLEALKELWTKGDLLSLNPWWCKAQECTSDENVIPAQAGIHK